MIHDGRAQRSWTPIQLWPLVSDRRCSGRASRSSARLVHRVEVFGPVATLMPYRDLEHASRFDPTGEGSW